MKRHTLPEQPDASEESGYYARRSRLGLERKRLDYEVQKWPAA